jgi:hypothetical protein
MFSSVSWTIASSDQAARPYWRGTMLWYAEQGLYRFYGIGASSVSYVDAAQDDSEMFAPRKMQATVDRLKAEGRVCKNWTR